MLECEPKYRDDWIIDESDTDDMDDGSNPDIYPLLECPAGEWERKYNKLWCG